MIKILNILAGFIGLSLKQNLMEDIMENKEVALENWFDLETHQEAVEMMEEDAVVPFGTALWP
ncbi:hypothetical protein BGC07_09985 [Piscirickettsia litoralis]|uniref:Mercuric reductase n=1 Tax=Piscirickettsia litoralis TaxID=1891921 RepID=A0ABX3A2U7_9GAMM|nr:hypothetical protein BGC07_09985 [Piscirickettsia litoralis]